MFIFRVPSKFGMSAAWLTSLRLKVTRAKKNSQVTRAETVRKIKQTAAALHVRVAESTQTCPRKARRNAAQGKVRVTNKLFFARPMPDAIWCKSPILAKLLPQRRPPVASHARMQLLHALQGVPIAGVSGKGTTWLTSLYQF